MSYQSMSRPHFPLLPAVLLGIWEQHFTSMLLLKLNVFNKTHLLLYTGHHILTGPINCHWQGDIEWRTVQSVVVRMSLPCMVIGV